MKNLTSWSLSIDFLAITVYARDWNDFTFSTLPLRERRKKGGKKRKKNTPTPKWLQVTSYNFGQVCTTTCLRTHPKIISSLTFTKTQLNSEPPWEIWVHKFRTGDQDANKSVDTSQEPLSLSLCSSPTECWLGLSACERGHLQTFLGLHCTIDSLMSLHFQSQENKNASFTLWSCCCYKIPLV